MQDQAIDDVANGIGQISLGQITLGSDVTKQSVREEVWEFLEKNNIAKFPRPVNKRIPNFEGASQACDNLPGLEAFKTAQTVKVNPDKPQEQARFLVLEGGKTLVVTPLRRSARKNVLHRMEPPQDASDKDLRLCSRYQGVKEFSVPVGFESKVHVDLVVVGCVAASKSGLRVGKGEGFADLEWAMMASMGAVNENTVVVASCHDCQVLDMPDTLFGSHDLTVDYILTPTQVIKCDKRPKPTQIIWSLLSEEKLERIPILKKLRFMERQAGGNTMLENQTEDLVVTAGEEYVEPEEPEEEEDEDRRRNRRRYNRQRRPRGGPRRSVENGEEGGDEQPQQQQDGESPRRGPPRQRRRRGPPRKSEGEQDEGEEGGEGGREGGQAPRGGQRRPRKRNPRRRRSQGSESRGEDVEEESGDVDKENRPSPQRRRNNFRRRSGPRRSTSDREDAPGAAGDEGADRPPRRPRRRSTNGPLPAVYVGNLPRGLRVSEFKQKFREQNVNPLRVTWRGQVGYSYLVFESMEQVDEAMKVLSGMSINDRELRVELANRTQQRSTSQGGEEEPRQQQEQDLGEGDA